MKYQITKEELDKYGLYEDKNNNIVKKETLLYLWEKDQFIWENILYICDNCDTYFSIYTTPVYNNRQIPKYCPKCWLKFQEDFWK